MPAVNAKIRACARHFQLLDRVLADRRFLCGDNLNLADISAGTSLYRYFEIDVKRPSVPHVGAGIADYKNGPPDENTSWSRSMNCTAASTSRSPA